jgi:hypothetical protein
MDRVADKVFGLFTKDLWTMMSKFEYVPKLVDPATQHIMAIVLGKAFDNEATNGQFHAKVSRKELGRRMFNHVRSASINERLRVLSQYWFLTVDTHRWVRTNVKDTQVITPNEAFKFIFLAGKTKEKQNFLSRCMEIGEDREVGEQGFRFTIPYGKPEIESNKLYDLSLGASYQERLDEKKAQEKDKREENNRWRLLSERFIEAAADVWVNYQRKEGYGEDQPLWAGDLKTMPATAKRERSELVKCFQSLGGYVTTLAWSLYCLAEPETKDGNAIFDRSAPWRQCVFSDKRPSQFSKNLQSLIKHQEFIDKSTDEWPEERAILKSWFGELVEQEPREGVTRDKIGYAFGKTILDPTIETI